MSVPAMLRLEIKNLPHDPQHVATPFLRRNILLDLVAEENQPDLVAVADGREGQHARQLRRHLALALRGRPEISRRAHVDQQQDGQLAFLGEFLHEGTSAASGHVPVDGPDFIARHVFTHLVEVHPAALEHRVIFAAHRAFDEPARADLICRTFLRISLAFCESMAVKGYGTGIVSMIFWTTASDVRFSASAS